tara:strand:+ start:962 stop:1333 length:372 start_codon:yes stop_codon:yes gene_type:complete
MKASDKHHEKIAKMKFNAIYPHYLKKVEKKGRNKEELDQVIKWLTRYDENELKNLIETDVTFKEFFENSKINPNAYLIKGTICGYRIEEIDNQLTKKVRFLDKLVDELAKGKKMEKILRYGIE